MSGVLLEIERSYMHGYLSALIDLARGRGKDFGYDEDERIDHLLRDAILTMTQDAYTLGKGPKSEVEK